MTPQEAKHAAAAIELADALLEEFNNPMSSLKGIGRVTMEKLLIYLKIVEKKQRRKAKRAADGDAEDSVPCTNESASTEEADARVNDKEDDEA